jgi:hypothetical protein
MGMHRCVVGTESILVVAVVDSDFDTDAGVDEPDYSRWDTDVVGVAPIGRTGKPSNSYESTCLCSKQEQKRKAYPATSVTKPPP